jgi:hypothetical protein
VKFSVLVLILRGSGRRSRSSSVTVLLSPVSGGLRLASSFDSKVVLLILFGLAEGTSEDVLVLLIREVNVIVSVGMTELSGVVSVVLPD